MLAIIGEPLKITPESFRNRHIRLKNGYYQVSDVETYGYTGKMDIYLHINNDTGCINIVLVNGIVDEILYIYDINNHAGGYATTQI
jgi:hypothetical protein